MNSRPLITIVAVISWFIGGWLAVRRDRSNKRRDLRVQYLIEAYRRLANGTERKETNAEYFADMDSALVDVQLFGSPDQTEAAQKFAKQLAEHRVAQSTELLASLRSDLRDKLKLERVGARL